MADTPTIIQTFYVETFDRTATTWSRWVQRLEGAFTVFETKENLKLHYLLHYMGANTYEILCDKLAPEEPKTKTYKEVVDLLQDFYSPTPLEVAEIFRFQSRKQKDGETVQEFCHALHKLSINCKFGTYLKSAIRNQLVFGMQSKRTQARLLETKDLTLEKVLEIAGSMELTEKDVKQLHGEASTVLAINTRKKKEVSASRVKKSANKAYGSGDVQNGSRNTGNKNYINGSYSNNFNATISCYRCGGTHLATKCSLNKNIVCGACGTKGHLQKVCMKTKKVHNVVEILGIQADDEKYREKFFIHLQVENKKVKFEIDSGSAVTLIGNTLFTCLFPALVLQPTNLKLISYCGTELNIFGYTTVKIQYNNTNYNLNIYVIEGNKQPLVGREWIQKLQLLHLNTYHIKTDGKDKLEILCKKYSSVFDGSMSKITGLQAKLKLKPGSMPVFMKARRVPFKLLPLVDKEINRLVDAGILEKVDSSEWATPIVPVLKSNNTVRLCGDFKVTLNPHLQIDEHPLPTIDELFSSMAGGVSFSKIDLQNAYLQMEVIPENRHLLTLNTHKGLYTCNRLLYGIASAPAIWQREIENILKDIPGVSVFLDDIKITGVTDEIHLQTLEKVFQRLQHFNIKINKDKSTFFQEQIEYCGYLIDRNGIHKSKKKIDAINKMPRPTNITEVRAFIGMINYYGRFFKNLSTILYPLNQLLHKDAKFVWNKHCERCFQTLKEMVQSDEFLVHYDTKLPLTVATDASSYGVGAVLSHVYPDGTERVIQYASQTLSETQRKYSQIDKEAYAIIFAVKKFYQYLYGNQFTLYTDHRPLIRIFSPSKGLPVYTAMRMQHYALFLQSFNYAIKYKNTKEHANADCLSRLPIKGAVPNNCDVVDVFQINTIETLPLTTEQLANETNKDPYLRKIVMFLQKGKEIPKHMRFKLDQNEFGLQQGILMRGYRAVIPKTLQNQILNELHEGHFGIVKMKGLARGICWWPGIDSDIEQLVRSCPNCSIVKSNPKKVETHVWEATNKPFDRVHADFAGPYLNKFFFILVDAYSKFPFVYVIDNITAKTTIRVCKEIFAMFGIPRVFVTDNGRTFCSAEFQNFLKHNNTVSKFTAPYNPATNGQAERFVQTLKKSLTSLKCNSENLYENVQKILMQYRIMPHSFTNHSPSSLMFGRQIRSRVNSFLPKQCVSSTTNIDKKVHEFNEGERVQCRNYHGKNKWLFGNIVKKLGRLHYVINMDDSRVWKRHINQIRKCYTLKPGQTEEDLPSNYDYDAENMQPETNVPFLPERPLKTETDDVRQELHEDQSGGTETQLKPKRTIRLPAKLQDYHLY